VREEKRRAAAVGTRWKASENSPAAFTLHYLITGNVATRDNQLRKLIDGG
jgi:hypothetical protein